MEKTIKILLPVDFGEEADIALEYAKFFAKGKDAEVYLLHVVEEISSFQKLFKDDDYMKRAKNQAKKALEEIDKELEGIKTHIKVKKGKPYDEIEDYAEDIEPTFILMGKTENPSLKKRIMGSNTIHVINETDYPVMTVRSKKVKDIQQNSDILVPLDLLKSVNEQVTAAIEFAKILNTNIRLLSVVKENSAAVKTKVLTNLNKTGKYIEEKGIKCQTHLVEDDNRPIYEIVNEYAEKYSAQMIVIMTRDEQNFREFVLGTNARDILDNSELPVLSVKPWKLDSGSSIFDVIYDPLGVLGK